MSFIVNRTQSLEYLTASTMPEGIVHCFTTRLGGVSEGVLSSMNLAERCGEKFANLVQNYEILGNAVGFSVQNLVFCKQTHSTIVSPVDTSNRGEGLFHPVNTPRDGIITDRPGVALVSFTADCTPVLLYDPVRRAIGAVHAGWRGTAGGILKAAIAQMQTQYGCNPANIHAAIGPCIGKCCFETNRDVPEAMLAALGEQAWDAMERVGEKYHVDLKRINEMWLQLAGVAHIDICQDCTACQPERFWSHRRMGDSRGSQGAIIMLK